MLRVSRLAVLSLRAQAVCRPGVYGLGFARLASADPPPGGTSLQEDSSTLRVCMMADFYAYAPPAAAAGARAYSAGRIKRQARLYDFCLTALVPPDAGTDARANTASILSPGGDLYSKSPASRFLEAERNQELFTVKVFYPSPQALSTAGRAKKPAFRQIPGVRRRSPLSGRFKVSINAFPGEVPLP